MAEPESSIKKLSLETLESALRSLAGPADETGFAADAEEWNRLFKIANSPMVAATFESLLKTFARQPFEEGLAFMLGFGFIAGWRSRGLVDGADKDRTPPLVM